MLIGRVSSRTPWRAVLVLALPACAAAAPLTGDWNGHRPDLDQQGWEVDLGYTGEAAHNLGGGFRRDSHLAYADQWTAGLGLNPRRLFGGPDALIRLTLTNRNGDNLTNERLVDPATGPVSSVQEVHGRGSVTRLTRFWYRQDFLNDTLRLKVGRIPVGDDFATLDSRFQNLYLGSGQPGNQAGGVWYNWPVSQWAAQGRLTLGEAAGGRIYLRAGVFDLNPENLDQDHGLSLYESGSEGTLTPVELGWEPQRAVFGLPGEYKVGGYYSNADTEDYRHGGETGRRYGAYFVARQQVSAPHDDERGARLFAMGTWHDRETAYVRRYLGAGVTYQGPVASRPDDEIGLGLAWAEVSDAYPTGQNQEQDEEWNAELYYRVEVTPWLDVQPNIQHVRNPGANPEVADAWVLGTRLDVVF